MKGHLLMVGIIVSLMMLHNEVDAAPSPFSIEHLTQVKNSLGRLGSFARQIADERVNRAMDRSLDTDSVEYLEQEVKHMKAIETILDARDRMMDVMHPKGEPLAPIAPGNDN